MIGYRISEKKEIERLMSSQSITNSNGLLHKGAANTFEKSNIARAFWFFRDLEDALEVFDTVGNGNVDVFSIICVDVPDECVYEQGRGSYCGGSPISGPEYREEYSKAEFTALRMRRDWLVDIYHLCQDETDTDYDGFPVFEYRVIS